MYLIKNG